MLILEKINFFWFRRDLRLEDNAGLYHALKDGGRVLPVFIFDKEILEALARPQDLRVQFIYETIVALKAELQKRGSDLVVRFGQPTEIWRSLLRDFAAEAIYTNHDYEPSAIKRDHSIENLCLSLGVAYHSFKDQVIFERYEIVTEAHKPYTVYTPYKKKWLASLSDFYLKSYPVDSCDGNFLRVQKKSSIVTMQDLGFERQNFEFPPIEVSSKIFKNYAETRDFPHLEAGTTHLGVHLRFGTVSVRELAREGQALSAVWLSELIWREFFMQVLFHFPQVEKKCFRAEYENVAWRNSEADFERWSSGMTGYPLVDAGMRELNATGYMHNRVRMVAASFLTKHLLQHWYKGERYFSKKLLDYDLASNNGNWQWSAGTGCDAAPYFRIFNPQTQAERFDKQKRYIQKWVPEVETSRYPEPMVEHRAARERALKAFKAAVAKKKI